MAVEGTSPQDMTATQKQAEAMRLRASGMSLDAIAKRLGYRSHSGVHKAISSGLKKTLREPADELRTLEAERLDRMLEGLWDQAINGGTWQVDRVLNIMERRARLLGLDTPVGKDRDPAEDVRDSFMLGAATMRQINNERKVES